MAVFGAGAQELWKQGAVQKLLLIALCAEIGYAMVNLSTMPVFLKDRQFGETSIAFVLVTFLLFEALFKSVSGHVADKYGTKILMVAGPLISVATCALSFAVPHTNGSLVEVFGFVLLRALDGIAVALLWPALFTQMNAVTKDEDKQQAMSYLNSCYMIGIALAYPLGGIVNDLTNQKWAGLVAASLLFMIASAVSYKVGIARTNLAQQEGQGGFRQFAESVKLIPDYLMLAMVTFIGVGFPLATVKLFAVDAFKLSETSVGGLIFPTALAMVGLSGVMARVGSKLGEFKSVQLGLGICFFGLTIIASGAVLPFMRTLFVLALGGLPVGLGFLLTIPAWMKAVSDISEERRATNIGAIMTAQGLGAIVGAPIGAFLYERLQPVGESLKLGKALGYYSPFVGCALCVGLGWLLAGYIFRSGGPAAERKALPAPSGPKITENQQTREIGQEEIEEYAPSPVSDR
jgi:DHA1 family multidrug resistance protein-like MFS transporter